MINPRIGLSMVIAALMAAGGGRHDGRTRTPTAPRPVANLDPARAGSGNKARLLERYQRRQNRHGGSDHG